MQNVISVNERITSLFIEYIPTMRRDIEQTNQKQAALKWFEYAYQTLSPTLGDIRREKALQDVVSFNGLIDRSTIAPYYNNDWLRGVHGIEPKGAKGSKASNVATVLPTFTPAVFEEEQPNASMIEYMGKEGKAKYLADLKTRNDQKRLEHEQSEAKRLLQTFEPFVAQTVASLKTVLTLPQMKQLFDAVFASIETEKSDLEKPF